MRGAHWLRVGNAMQWCSAGQGACLGQRLVLQGCQGQADEVCHPRPHRLHQACWVEQQGQRAQHLHSMGAWKRGADWSNGWNKWIMCQAGVVPAHAAQDSQAAPSARPAARLPACPSTHLGRIQQRLCHAVRHQAAHQDVGPAAAGAWAAGAWADGAGPTQGNIDAVVQFTLDVARQHVQVASFSFSHRPKPRR